MLRSVLALVREEVVPGAHDAIAGKIEMQEAEAVLERLRPAGNNAGMSTKQIVADLLQKLPENVTLHAVPREIEFVAAVRQGLGELDRAEGIPLDEVEREFIAKF